MLRAIDVCCGAGGWAMATRGTDLRIIAAFDLAEDCCRTYRYNHPDVEVICGDVRRQDFSRWRGVDVVLGSIPCEEISVARANKKPSTEIVAGWRALLDRALEIANEIGAEYWCLENVVQMRRELPPLTPHQVLNSRGYSAQNRSRVFVGKFPRPAIGTSVLVLSDVLRPGPYVIPPRVLDSTIKSNSQWYTSDTKRVLSLDRKAPTVTDFGSRHSRGFVVEHDGRERVISFGEAAALQGFPDDYVFVASQTRVWKMVAQAIQIDLGRAIVEGICAHAAARLEEACA